jgi:hypothetical protein
MPHEGMDFFPPKPIDDWLLRRSAPGSVAIDLTDDGTQTSPT